MLKNMIFHSQVYHFFVSFFHMSKLIKEHFHRRQLNRAQMFIRENLSEQITLEKLSSISGASPYHFIRVFKAYIGETPFSYIRRERILKSLAELMIDDQITQIAMNCGFENVSSFNKAFKKFLELAPGEFRNLGKAEREKIIHNLKTTAKVKEIMMKINMEMKPEIIERNETIIYSYGVVDSSFKEAAQHTWDEFLKILPTVNEDLSKSEFMGVGEMLEEKCSYKAAISLPTNENVQIKGLKREVIPHSKYAKFLLKGSYEGIWYAFDEAFKYINESDFQIGSAPCLELYLNDPSITPEEELLTEILIPIC